MNDEQEEALRQVIDNLEWIEAEAENGIGDMVFITKKARECILILRRSFKEIR